MDFEQTTDVAPGSSPGIAPSPDPSSAGTQNTEQFQGQVQDARGNTFPTWRINQIREQAREQARREIEAERTSERQRLEQDYNQRLIQALQGRVQQPSRTPEEEMQRLQAQRVLHELAPGLKAMPVMAQALLEQRKQMAQQQAAIDRMSQHQEQSATQGRIADSERQLVTLAQQAGLRFQDRNDYDRFCRLVVAEIRSTPGAYEAWRAGDQSVLPEAFQNAKQTHDYYRSQQTAALAQNKAQMLQNVPRRMVGAAASGAPHPTFDPKDPRGSKARIDAAAQAFLEAAGA